MTLEHLLTKVRTARDGGLGVLSTGEALAAALVLNRADWLASMGYTIADALRRLDDDIIGLIPTAARLIEDADEVIAQAQDATREEAELDQLGNDGEVIDVTAKVVTFGQAPGYRDLNMVFALQRIGIGSEKTHTLRMHVDAEDCETILRQIIEVQRFTWRPGSRPLDAKEGETRPKWLDKLDALDAG